ncbi:hypothetical protein AX16_004106 [Volvariella volvacea WC 439]|nr:hypothetical protein AX16_004106 [Volvariella volvacea WC 439]
MEKVSLDQLWISLQDAQISLEHLDTAQASTSLLNYLSSFRGLKFLAIKVNPKYLPLDGTDIFFNTALMKHNSTLESLSITIAACRGAVEKWHYNPVSWNPTLCSMSRLTTLSLHSPYLIMPDSEGFFPAMVGNYQEVITGVECISTLRCLTAISRGRWASAFPDGDEDRLRLAHFRLTQLLVYLYRPEDPNPENAERLTYYLTFKSAKPGTEIRRARDAIAIIIRAVLKCLSTIPLDSGVRRHTTIFDVVDNLTTISDTYMDQGGRVEEWTEFWGGTQLVLLDLNKKLESAGFGFGSQSEGARLMSRTEEQATGEEESGDGALGSLPDFWFQALESTARSPLLTFYYGDHEDRLAHARSRMLQIFLYLFAEPGQRRRFFDFASATVGPETEIARARIAVAIITRTVIDNLSTIPMDSQVRSKYHAIFDRVDVLVALKKKHLMDESGRVKNWATFWMKAQSELLHLGTLLDEAGIESSKKK